MPRRYYTKRTVVVRPKKKWASIMKSNSFTPAALTSGSSVKVAQYDLVINSADSATPTPIIVKTGNFKVYGTLNTDITEANIQKLWNVTGYIMYCPQGYTYTDDMTAITNHPEYIMGRTTMKFVPGQNSSFSISSRLKRNLNSGDSIKLLIAIHKDSSLTGTLNTYLNLQYYTCAN